jgi:hypothetical protein
MTTLLICLVLNIDSFTKSYPITVALRGEHMDKHQRHPSDFQARIYITSNILIYNSYIHMPYVHGTHMVKELLSDGLILIFQSHFPITTASRHVNIPAIKRYKWYLGLCKV